MSQKRKYDVIDLTGDDSPVQPQRARNAYPTELQREDYLDEFETDAANDIIISSQGNDDELRLAFQPYGVLATRVVGVRYYTGYASEGEYVIVKRQPLNQYDSNAIAIENVQHDQIGHIPRDVASRLAKYMDNGSLLVEGALSGRIGAYDCPVTLKLFGPSDPVERANLRQQMKDDRLPCQVVDQTEQEAKRRKREELKNIAAAKKARKAEKGRVLAGGQPGVYSQGEGSAAQPWGYSQGQWPAGQPWGSGQGQWPVEQPWGSSQGEWSGTMSQGSGLASSQSLDNIMETAQRFNPRDMSEVVEKFGLDEAALANLPMADFPKKLATKLLPYQRQALHWLLEKENPQLPPAGSDDSVQLWKRSKHTEDVYTNIATNFSLKGTKPVLASGGILSDDMGMGKTLEMIALIVSDTQTSGSSRCTLIIAPVGVMSNWTDQIAHHVKGSHTLNVLVYHGTGKRPFKPEEAAQYDVIVTSYATLANEYCPRDKKDAPPLPRAQGLFSVKWRRVILDEGHTIRNPQTKAALAATNLLARSKWVLTGTPIINNLKDLYSLVRFIGLTGGLERLEIFNSILARPVKAGDVSASLLLQALMATICLRRKKEMKFVDLRLPPLSEYVHRVEFYPSEREKYNALQAEAKGLLHNVTHTIPSRNRTLNNGQSKAQDNYRHLLEILLRLRQVCNHWSLCGERLTSILSILEAQKMVELTSANKKALQDMLQLSIDTQDDCPICLEPLHNPVITACAHAFGYECIERVIETQHRCPMCRADPLELDSLVRPAVDLGESALSNMPSENFNPETSSSKIEALLNILLASRKKDPSTKTVIFSQWTSFLNIIGSALSSRGLSFVRIDGTMRPPARDAALASLNTDPSCTIMLASLAVCSVGLNLVAANQVILADSWWAPAIEDQAVDRVHRLGQRKATTVWRLVMDGSIEESVLEIQKEKRKLMATAFMEKDGDGGAGKRGKGVNTRLADIQRLLT